MIDMPMYYYPMFDSTYLIYVLIPLLISMWASARVNSTFKKYSTYTTQKGVAASQVTRMILDRAGLNNVEIERVDGNLTDHFDPRTNVIRLSQSVYDSTSVAAIGVAAHEAGHAMQYAKGYMPIKLRNFLVPVVNFSSRLAMPLILLGFFMELGGLVDFAIILYGAVVLFSLITLPVELNASKRALAVLGEYGALTLEETGAAKKVLGAAAMTYVASMLAALGSFIRILTLFGRRND